MTDFNQFAKKHGARREIWDEDLKFRYKNKSLKEFTASVYGMPYQDYPNNALTSEAAYLQWCAQVALIMPETRGKKFRDYIRERLADAEEEEIPPNLEEGIEVEVVILNILKNRLRNARNFDNPQPEERGSDELVPSEWLFVETAEDSKCGMEVFIKFEGLKACILHEVACGNTETKITRKEAIAWLQAHGRHYGKEATVNRRRCAYALPYTLVDEHRVFSLRTFTPRM